MIGQKGWKNFAKENGITWEVGPPNPRDQYGTEYYTLIAGDAEFASNLKKLLGNNKHIVVRMFPHCADPRGKVGATRMRLSVYAEKPA